MVLVDVKQDERLKLLENFFESLPKFSTRAIKGCEDLNPAQKEALMVGTLVELMLVTEELRRKFGDSRDPQLRFRLE